MFTTQNGGWPKHILFVFAILRDAQTLNWDAQSLKIMLTRYTVVQSRRC